MLNILLVCSGNTCRSPMAEVLLRHKIGQAGYQHLVAVASAGTSTADGEPASRHAQTVMREIGLDLSQHRSRQLQPGHIGAAALVLTMTPAHKRLAQMLVPESSGRIYTLQEFSGYLGRQGISDPYGSDLLSYRACAAEIDQLLVEAWRKIAALAGKKV